ncbi:MAG: alpha/beta hydrolase [Alphaproteobacteria bacterium]|nr:alpha/beta hydrolase [Alphaproteobacteria bacterium]
MTDSLTFTANCHDGAQILVRILPRPGAPRLLLSHGNGFAIGGYRKFWELLTPDFELCLFDMRNHGANPLHTLENHTLENMSRDLLSVRSQIAAKLDPRFTGGVFHSVSSIACIRGCASLDAKWDGLILVDPPLIAPPGNPLREGNYKLDDMLSALALKRPSHFAGTQELATQLRARAGRNWVAGADVDMAEATTRPAAAGGRELSCPGAFEAQIYGDNRAYDSYEALEKVSRPVLILGADPAMERALTPAFSGPEAAARYGIPHVIVPGTGHLLQIEKPELSAVHVRDFILAQSAAKVAG